MKIVKGDLLALAKAGEFDVIIQGCNCFHLMGAGIAKQIKDQFPVAYSADLTSAYGDARKLGTVTVGSTMTLFIVNGYTQFRPGRNVDYAAIRRVFSTVKQLFEGRRIGYPKIGAGIAGGDWDIISKIIDEELEGEDHTLVVL